MDITKMTAAQRAELKAQLDSVLSLRRAAYLAESDPLRMEADYDALVAALDELLDLVGEDESNPLMSLVDILSDWIEAYDHEHRPMPIVSGVDVETFI